jgi:tripartite motif-containing protein 71
MRSPIPLVKIISLPAALLLLAVAAQANVVKATHAWGTRGSNDGQFYDVRAVAAGPFGDVYIADRPRPFPVVINRIQQFDDHGRFKRSIGKTGAAHGEFNDILDLAVDRSNGDFYVLDAGNARIQRFSHNGHFLRAWGSGGTGQGQLHGPRAIAVTNAGDVYVTDNIGASGRIQQFTRHGEFVRSWACPFQGNGSGLAVWDDTREVFLISKGEKKIYKYTFEGHLLSKWSTTVAGSENRPDYGIAVNSLGLLLVLADGDRHVRLFTSDGHYLHQFQIKGNYDPAHILDVSFMSDDVFFAVDFNDHALRANVPF